MRYKSFSILQGLGKMSGGDKDLYKGILVIDNDTDCADSLCALIECLGGVAHAAYSGREGVEQFNRLKPDIVIIELALPDMAGIEVAEQIRAAAAGRQVMLVATDGRHWVNPKLIAAVFDMMLFKPISTEMLSKLIDDRPKA